MRRFSLKFGEFRESNIVESVRLVKWKISLSGIT